MSQPLLGGAISPAAGSRRELDGGAGGARGAPSCCSRALFSWVGPLLHRGSTQPQLHRRDLLPLPPDLEPEVCGGLLWSAWAKASEAAPHLPPAR